MSRDYIMEHAEEVDLVMNTLYDEISSRKWDKRYTHEFWLALKEAVEHQIEYEDQQDDLQEKYICVHDYQDTYFHIGDTKTAEEWKEWALSMNDMDECENREEFEKLSAEEAIDYIQDMWQIEIVKYDPSSPEHQKLRKAYENDD